MNLDALKNIHKDRSAIVFTCGPSLNSYDKESMKEFSKGKIVATVKQAAFRYGDISDYHFFNDNNFLKYVGNYKKIASSANPEIFGKMVWGDQEIDHTFKIKNVIFDQQLSTSHTLNFEEMLLDSGPERPWGPGIMYETVLPFLIWTGVNRIYVNGWDYTTSDGLLKHYYNEEKVGKKLKNSGEKIGTMVKDEKKIFIESTEHLHGFLNSIGVELIIVSECSEISSKFERFYVG